MIEVIHEQIDLNGKEVLMEHGRRAPGVRLIIETPDGELLINHEMRGKIGLDYRLPGGKVFDSLKEFNEFLSKDNSKEEIFNEARRAAIQEAEEEVGVRPTDFELFHLSRCGGSFEWDLYYFVVTKYEEVGQNPEEHEKIQVLKVTRDKMKELALSGVMQEDRSVAVILRYLLG